MIEVTVDSPEISWSEDYIQMSTGGLMGGGALESCLRAGANLGHTHYSQTDNILRFGNLLETQEAAS